MFSTPGESDLVKSFVFGKFSGINDLRRQLICDLLTSEIYQVEGTVLVSFRIFVNKNTSRLKR